MMKGEEKRGGIAACTVVFCKPSTAVVSEPSCDKYAEL